MVTLRSERDALLGRAEGATREQAAATLASAQAFLAAATVAAAELAGLEAGVADLRREQQVLAARLVDAAASVAALRESSDAADRDLRAIEADLARTLALGPVRAPGTGRVEARSTTGTGRGTPSAATASGGGGDLAVGVGAVPAPGALRRALVAVEDALALLADAQHRLEVAEAAGARVEALTTQALDAARQHGFGTLDEVGSAGLTDSRRRELARSLEARAVTELRARAVLDDPALAPPDDDLHRTAAELAARSETLTVLLATAEDDARSAAGAVALHEDRAAAAVALTARLRTALSRWAPVRDDAERADSLSRLVRGMGHDNLLQMRLSAYVLATRLDQVVAAANERLGHLRDQRYLLRRTGRAERRASQAGLGLEMLDQWTGDVRAPSTLSGGETFVVSLSLALGLADVVTQESGGTEIETLFVDEGFGTLDADTLDDVMDRLDGLRAGGRTVGVVSHVSELRERIPTQVQVDKGRSGSTVTVRTLVG